MRRFSILVILLVVASLQAGNAQKRRAERAYEAFNAGEYYTAIDHFKDTYSKTSKSDKTNRTEIVYMIAECYRLSTIQGMQRHGTNLQSNRLIQNLMHNTGLPMHLRKTVNTACN